MEKKAIIAMSGGVDSSVAALLCQQQGFDCMGVTLALTNNEDRGIPQEKTCCSVDDVADARSVAFRLGMPFYVFNFKDAFRREVMGRFGGLALPGRNGLWPHRGTRSLRRGASASQT